MSSEREDLAEVLSAHRIVGVSGYGIESVMCACQYNGWTGGGKWHPADWHPRHVAKKLRAAGWRPPTERTDAEVRPGQVWADNDQRAVGRTVRIERIDGDHAIVTVLTAYRHATPGERARSVGKERRIRITRFRPNSTGYRLLEAPDKERAS